MKTTKLEFLKKIVDAVRAEAQNQGIVQGAIEIRFSPANNIALDWLGTLPETDVSYALPVVEGTTTVYTDPDTGNEAGDCAGVTSNKIAAAKRAMKHFEEAHPYDPLSRTEHTSGAMPEEYNGNGRINWKGCVAIPIGVLIYGAGPCGMRGMEAFTIFVSVSGGTQDQDEAAAWAALPVIRSIVHENEGWMLQRNFYGDESEDAPEEGGGVV